MRASIARLCMIAVAIAAALGAGTSIAQRRPATDAEAMTYIFSAFLTQADPGVMSRGVRLGPELEKQLALSDADSGKIYQTLVGLTGGKFDVRKATPEEIAAYGPRRGFDPASAHPLYTLEAGPRRFLLQYDPHTLNVAFVGQLGLPDPEARPKAQLAKQSEPAALGLTVSARKPEAPKPVTVEWTGHFGFAETRANLEALPAKLKTFGEIRFVRVSGHADRIGSAEYNQRLSEKRAESVRDYLVEQGMPADKIETFGYGKTLPVAACREQLSALIACLAPNRRVVVEIQGMPATPELEAKTTR